MSNWAFPTATGVAGVLSGVTGTSSLMATSQEEDLVRQEREITVAIAEIINSLNSLPKGQTSGKKSTLEKTLLIQEKKLCEIQKKRGQEQCSADTNN